MRALHDASMSPRDLKGKAFGKRPPGAGLVSSRQDAFRMKMRAHSLTMVSYSEMISTPGIAGHDKEEIYEHLR